MDCVLKLSITLGLVLFRHFQYHQNFIWHALCQHCNFGIFKNSNLATFIFWRSLAIRLCLNRQLRQYNNREYFLKYEFLMSVSSFCQKLILTCLSTTVFLFGSHEKTNQGLFWLINITEFKENQKFQGISKMNDDRHWNFVT